MSFGHSEEFGWNRLTAPVLSRDRRGIWFPSGLPRGLQSVLASLQSLKRVNTSIVCHSQITTGAGRLPRMSLKVSQRGLPSSRLAGSLGFLSWKHERMKTLKVAHFFYELPALL